MMKNNFKTLEAVFGKLHPIVYRPDLRQLTKSVTANILLNQMWFWWKQQGKKKFYKFRAPCKHKLYKKGDSWCEELGFSPNEFDTALKTIGFKLGKTKNCIEKDQALILYYRDNDNLTWYELNENLLKKLVNKLFSSDSLVNGESRTTKDIGKAEVPLKTETTTETTKDLSFNSEIKRDAEAQKTDEKTSPLADNSFDAARAANFEKSERPSLKGYTLSDLIELFEANPREPPAGISRPQMLAAILDKIPGFEAITAKNNWKTIMVRLGQLCSDKRKEPLEYRDLIASAIKFKTIPKPKDKPANLDYLIAVLTYSAQELAEDRFEAEHYARKLSHGELREVNALIADMADDFRMKDDRIKDSFDLDRRRESLKAALRESQLRNKQQWPSLGEEDGRITGNTS